MLGVAESVPLDAVNVYPAAVSTVSPEKVATPFANGSVSVPSESGAFGVARQGDRHIANVLLIHDARTVVV